MNKKLISLITASIIVISSSVSVVAKSFNSQQNIALDHAWTVNFNQKVNVNEAFEGVYIEDSKGNKIPTRVDFSDDHTKMIIKPTDGYAPNSTYTLNVEGVSDEDGKPLSDKATMEFTTANTAQVGSFDITSATANNGQGAATTNLDPNSSFSFQLSKNVDPSTVNNVTVTDKDGNKANVKVEVVGSNISVISNNAFQDDTKTVTIPQNTYKCNTTYTVNLAGVKSTDGQDIETKTYNFTTRDYQLNPTVSGICNDDYFKFASQYDSDLFNPVDPATGYVKVGLWKAHDNNGTIVFDKDTYGTPYQVSSDWNKYANLQVRNQYDLAVQFRKQYNQILAKNSDYSGKMVVMNNSMDRINEALFNITTNANADMPSDMLPIRIYSSYSLGEKSLDSVDLQSNNPDDMKNILRSDAHPQVYILFQLDDGIELNLQKLYLYQELVSLFGYDYAPDIENYMIKETGSTNDIRDTMQKVQIGNVTIWAEDGQFLFKY